MLREGGASSNLRCRGLLDRPPSRTMTIIGACLLPLVSFPRNPRVKPGEESERTRNPIPPDRNPLGQSPFSARPLRAELGLRAAVAGWGAACSGSGARGPTRIAHRTRTVIGYVPRQPAHAEPALTTSN